MSTAVHSNCDLAAERMSKSVVSVHETQSVGSAMEHGNTPCACACKCAREAKSVNTPVQAQEEAVSVPEDVEAPLIGQYASAISTAPSEPCNIEKTNSVESIDPPAAEEINPDWMVKKAPEVESAKVIEYIYNPADLPTPVAGKLYHSQLYRKGQALLERMGQAPADAPEPAPAVKLGKAPPPASAPAASAGDTSSSTCASVTAPKSCTATAWLSAATAEKSPQHVVTADASSVDVPSVVASSEDARTHTSEVSAAKEAALVPEAVVPKVESDAAAKEE